MPDDLHSIQLVNDRIDHCIRSTSGYEKVLWTILIIMFCAGIFLLGYGAYEGKRYLMGVAIGANGVICWPIARLIQLHRRKVALSVIPAITALLSPKDAARELHLLVARLLDK
jgi:hypothetical protein